jgi:hypothetical protein
LKNLVTVVAAATPFDDDIDGDVGVVVGGQLDLIQFEN